MRLRPRAMQVKVTVGRLNTTGPTGNRATAYPLPTSYIAKKIPVLLATCLTSPKTPAS